MKRNALFRNPTTTLWLLNALGVFLVLSAAFYRIGPVFLGSGVTLPKIGAIPAQPIQQLAAIPGTGDRNPFDPASAQWSVARPDDSQAQTGELRGIIRLPGVQLALTGSGTARIGEPVAGGKIRRILNDRIVVENATGMKEIELPSAHRPTLGAINKTRQSVPGKAN